MATLSQITRLDPELLQGKFDLEPRICYDPNQKENLLFLSPLVLLEDLELREGGFQERGAKEVLSRVAKHICESKDSSLFQVPEITYFYMGYGKNSENKKCQMAIDKEEAEVWMSFLNLSRFSRERDPAEEDEQSTAEGEESRERDPAEEDEGSASVVEETPMEIDFPTPRDTQALDLEDSVNPGDNGLQIPLKGSYMLLFSILLIFFEKKNRKKSESSTDDEPKIGANKISDFLLFWSLPYLLNYTNRKIREIITHHSNNNRVFDQFERKSTFDIIHDAMLSCKVSPELKHAIMTKYKDFYGTEQLEYEYKLLVTENGAPIILVPKRYKVTQMPAELQDIGSRWRELGDVKLFHQFMSKLIKNKEIQKDFLNSLPLLKHRQGVDYAILLPDEETFNELIRDVENNSAEYLSSPTRVEKQGRNLIAPRICLVTSTEKHLAVCFSYLQGNTSKKVAALFRAIGAHYLDHFTLVLLHGLCLNPHDPQCKVGSLYPVSCARKVLFKGSRLKKKGEEKSKEKKEEKKDFSEGQGRFCKAEFPETYKSFEQEVRSNPKVDDLIKRTEGNLKVDPAFNHNAPVVVAYSKTACAKKLGGDTPFGATFAQTKESLEKFKVRAVNLDGFLLSMIAKSGRKDNIAPVLAIKDVCGKDGSCLPNQTEAIRSIVVNFARAVVVAGLPKVYPSEPDEEDRVEVEEDDEESSDDDDDDDNEQLVPSGATSSGESGIVASNSSSETATIVKAGTPEDEELERLADGVERWKPLGRRLQIKDAKLTAFEREIPEFSERVYQMLSYWKQKNGKAATYQILFNALKDDLVSHRDLGEEFCCECL
ncbi:hypothetical protein ACROYT_G004516 [Oculina patagonica]